MDIEKIKWIGEMNNIDKEIRDRLWDIRIATEEAGKTLKVNFYKLSSEMDKVTTLTREINELYTTLIVLRNKQFE
jgi:hypothetical protein